MQTQSRSLHAFLHLVRPWALWLSIGSLACAQSEPAVPNRDTVSLLERVEATPLSGSANRPVKRIERDSSGAVTHLRLDDMTLSPADLAALASMPSLQSLVLAGTNIRDEDLAKLAQLKSLRHLNLNRTGIGDGALDELAKIDSLKSLCMANVRMSPDRVRKFIRDRKVSVGFIPIQEGQSDRGAR